jgi:hypothetical protein
MLSVAQFTLCRVVGWLVDNDLEIMWKEAAVTYFKLFGIRLTGLRKDNKKYVRVVGGPAEIRT